MADDLGGVIYPIAFRQMLPRLGFAWSVRAVGFIALGTGAIALATLRVRTRPPKRRLLFDPTAFKEPPFALFSIAFFFGLMGLYIPTFYIQSFAIQNHITDANLAAFMLPILNAGGVIGRLLPNFFADKTGPMNMLMPFFAVAALMAFVWIAVVDTGGLIVFALIYGFCSGAILSLPVQVVVSLSPSLGVIGTRMGTSFAVCAFGLLIGNPVSGAILKNTGHYEGVQAFAGVLLMLAAIFLCAARYYKAGSAMRVKV